MSVVMVRSTLKVQSSFILPESSSASQSRFLGATYRTLLGPISIIRNDKGIVFLGFNQLSDLYEKNENDTVLKAAAHYINELYQDGHSRISAPVLDFTGTAFQNAVWQELLKIPFGQTCSYQDIARRIGMHSASRAVGNAVGANKIALLIPCHRVIRGDGSFGHYAWGSDLKRAILQKEQIVSRGHLSHGDT